MWNSKKAEIGMVGERYVDKRTGYKIEQLNTIFMREQVTTTIHNIIVGKLWIDNHGDMDIIGTNNAKGVNCHLKFIPYSYFTRETQRKVKGVIMNRDSQVKLVLSGTWDNKIEIAHVNATSGSTESPVYKTGNYKTVWVRRMPPSDSDKYVAFFGSLSR